MTVIELFFLLVLIGIGTGTRSYVARFFGVWAGIVAGVFATIGFLALTNFLGKNSHRRHCRKMAKKYTRIFRVVALPTDEKVIIKPKGSEIKLGDNGWECGPIRKNGLIYLEGLNEKWQMIWWAGFRPEQIEYVGPKPLSQYDRLLADRKEIFEAPCPFPVQPREN